MRQRVDRPPPPPPPPHYYTTVPLNLQENLKALQLALLDARPKSSPKGVYFKSCVLSSTMGVGVPVAAERINPQSKYFLMSVAEEKKLGL